MIKDDTSSFLPVLVALELLLVEVVALVVVGFLGFGGAIQRWRDRRRLRDLGHDYARVVRSRNDVLHDVMSIRRAAEREMRRIVDTDVIDAESWEER